MEDIIMNTIVSAIITASATLIGIFFIETLYGKKIFSKLEKHDEIDISGHQNLSKEHMELKNNANNILQINQKIENKIETIDRTLFTEKESKKMQFDSLSDKQKEMKNSLDRIVGFADEWQRVSLQNTNLQKEIEEFKNENQILKSQNRELRMRFEGFQQENQILKSQNETLVTEFEEFKQENLALRSRNRSLRDRIDDLEQDYEYER